MMNPLRRAHAMKRKRFSTEQIVAVKPREWYKNPKHLMAA
jgi:hypothetical protein